MTHPIARARLGPLIREPNQEEEEVQDAAEGRPGQQDNVDTGNVDAEVGTSGSTI